MSDWRTITAEQFRLGGEASGDFDEAFIKDHNGWRREVWDVGIDQDGGNVVIYTAAADPLIVPPSHPIRVR